MLFLNDHVGTITLSVREYVFIMINIRDGNLPKHVKEKCRMLQLIYYNCFTHHVWSFIYRIFNSMINSMLTYLVVALRNSDLVWCFNPNLVRTYNANFNRWAKNLIQRSSCIYFSHKLLALYCDDYVPIMSANITQTYIFNVVLSEH